MWKENCGGSIRINRNRNSDLCIQLRLFVIIFLLQKNFVKENNEPYTGMKIRTKYKNLFRKKNIKTLFFCLHNKKHPVQVPDDHPILYRGLKLNPII